MFFSIPGLVGLALSYALSVTSLLSGVISSFTQTETQMVSVERLDEYITEIPSEHQDEYLEVREKLVDGRKKKGGSKCCCVKSSR